MHDLTVVLFLSVSVSGGACGDDDSADGDSDGDTDVDTDTDTDTDAGFDCTGITAVEGQPDLELELVAGGLLAPLGLVSPPGDDRLFVVDQPGRIWIVQDGERLPQPF